MEEKKRITVVVGAGAILDFDLPEGVQKPSTKFITDEVIGIKETNSISGTVITEIAEIYNVLKK